MLIYLDTSAWSVHCSFLRFILTNSITSTHLNSRQFNAFDNILYIFYLLYLDYHFFTRFVSITLFLVLTNLTKYMVYTIIFCYLCTQLIESYLFVEKANLAEFRSTERSSKHWFKCAKTWQKCTQERCIYYFSFQKFWILNFAR